MKISASILAADQNDIINNLNDKKGLFDYVHIDIGDNVFCPTYGISKNNVYKLVNETTYKLDIHLMIDEFPKFLENLVKENNNIIKVSHHVESNSINKFIDVMQKQDSIDTGFGILGSSDLNIFCNVSFIIKFTSNLSTLSESSCLSAMKIDNIDAIS